MITVWIVRILLGTLVASGLLLAVRWTIERKRVAVRGDGGATPTPLHVLIGFVTNFFDTLGIGPFATTTSVYKLTRAVADERIVGTLLVGHSLPVVVQAFIFLVAVPVDPVVLAALIAISILGSWLGAGVAATLPRRPIQLFMGTGLLAAAAFMFMSQIGAFPSGGVALTLTSWKLVFALVVNFFLGALLMLGIGSYAPSLILFSILGWRGPSVSGRARRVRA